MSKSRHKPGPKPRPLTGGQLVVRVKTHADHCGNVGEALKAALEQATS